PVERAPLAMQIAEPPLPLQQLELALEHIDGVVHLRSKLLSAKLVHEAVGILTVGKRHDLNGHPVSEQLVAGAEGGLQPRLVAVVEQVGVSGKASHERRLLFGKRGAQRRHRPRKARGHEAYHVEIPLHDHDAVITTDDMARHVKAIEQPTLREDLRIGGIEILGFTRAEQAAAKSGAVSLGVKYGEHEPVAESGTQPTLIVALREHAGIEEPDIVYAESIEVRAHGVGIARREAESEPVRHLLRHAAQRQVVARRAPLGPAPERRAKIISHRGIHIPEWL